jgi:chromosome segregation ATPase
MAFDYNKNKDGGGAGDSFWTSYSDLFLGMSVVFLLLYVTASLRTGTSGLQAQVENKKLTMQVDDLKNQLKMYDSVKKDYLNQEATPDEAQQYNELMDKLSLLQEEAHDEREKLARQSHEQQTKEKALNEYQQMVRNMINANTIAKTKIKRREGVIEKQDDTIEVQDEEITNLETDVQNKQQQIAENERKIEQANEKLDQRLKQLKQAFKQKKMTERAYEAQMAKAKAEADAKLDRLHETAKTYEKQLAKTENQLGVARQELQQTQAALDQTSGKLVQTSQELGQTKNKLGQVANELGSTKGQLAQTEGELDQTKDRLGQVAGELGKTKGKLGQVYGELGQTKGQLGQLQGELGQTKSKLGQVSGELGKTKGQLGQVANELGKTKNQLGQVASELGQTKDQLGQVAGELGKTKGQLGQAKGKIGQLAGDLAKAKAEQDARKEIAQRMRNGFAKAGVKADIDDRTGEVVINFGDVYFDNDSAQLKTKMKDVLQKAMPEYSKALFGDPKLRDKITSVEIVGFSSPTYQGKYVDPKSLDPNVRKAVDYNLDLSYRRARAIFQHIFDDSKMNFSYQKDLLPLIKVTGRSFLAEKMDERRNPSSKNFCDTHDCKKAQRVIIKFSFDDKK